MATFRNGGQTRSLTGDIKSIRFVPSSSTVPEGLEMWITDKEGNESLSYIDVNEAMCLIAELKIAVTQKMNQM